MHVTPPGPSPPTDDSLYSVLGLAGHFTAQDVNSNAKAALQRIADDPQLSPDDRAAMIYRVQLARRVLTDDLKRRIYDTGGEDAVAYVEATFALSMARQFGLHVTIVLGTVILMLLVATEMVFTLLVSLYVDGYAVSISVMAAPLFVLGCCLIAATVVGFVLRCCEDDDDGNKTQTPDVEDFLPAQRSVSPPLILSTVFLYGAALITLASLIVASAERLLFVIPAFMALMGEVVFVGAAVEGIAPESVALNMRRFGFRIFSTVNVAIVCACRFVMIFSRSALLSVLILRASGVITCTWYVVFIPGLMMLGSFAVGALNMAQMRSKEQSGYRGVEPKPKLGVFLFSCYIIVSSLLAYKLDNWDATPLPLWACFVPLWLAAFIILGKLSMVAIQVCDQDVATDDP